jgi:hypothetical protein
MWWSPLRPTKLLLLRRTAPAKEATRVLKQPKHSLGSDSLSFYCRTSDNVVKPAATTHWAPSSVTCCASWEATRLLLLKARSLHSRHTGAMKPGPLECRSCVLLPCWRPCGCEYTIHLDPGSWAAGSIASVTKLCTISSTSSYNTSICAREEDLTINMGECFLKN